MEILASWDNGSQYDLKMSELMNKYSIKTVFFLPSSFKKDKQMNEFEYKLLASNFEIGSCGSSQKPLKKMTIPQIAMEINGSRKILQDISNQEINKFAYPKNSISSLTSSLAKGAGYTSARTRIVGNLKQNEDFNKNCTVQIGLDRIEYDNKCWELFSDELILQLNESSEFHLFGNSLDIENNNDWQNLELLLQKLKSI